MKTVACAVVLGCAVWVAALVAAPAAAASVRPAANAAAAAVYAAGSFVCHQRPERSFRLNGRPLAVCARCTGLYVSALAGGLLALLIGAPARPRADRLWLALAAMPTGASWIAERAGLALQSNAIRATAALPLGFAAALIVIGLLMAEHPAERRATREATAAADRSPRST